MKKSIKKDVVIDASIEDVWRAITNQDTLSNWYMKTSDFEPVVGTKFTFTDAPQGKWDGKVLGEVLQVEAPNLLVYTFWGNQMNYTTTVKWMLREEGGQTRVTIEHDGFEGFGGWLMGTIIALGWKKFLKRLEQHLAGN